MSMRVLNQLGSWTFGHAALMTCSFLACTNTCALGAQLPQARLAATPVAAPGQATSIQRLYLNKNVIQLPIEINDQDRPHIREIHLYVKQEPIHAWTLRDKAGPNQRAFFFQTPRDGEYAFTMMIIDKQGRTYPNDIRNEMPALVVVIDTQAPSITLTNLGAVPEGQMVQCEVRDVNMNSAKMQFCFQGGDKFFRPLDPIPGRRNVYCVPSQAVFTGVVRASVEDLAGNQAFCERQISELPIANTLVINNQPGKAIKAPAIEFPNRENKSEPIPLIESVVHAVVPKASSQRQINRNSMDLHLTSATQPREHTSKSKQPREFLRPDVHHDVKRAPVDNVALSPSGPRESVKRLAHEDEASNSLGVGLSPQTVSHHPLTRKDLPKRQLVNQSKVYLDFQIENIDPSGVGKVETWVTRDNGQRWIKLCEDTHGKSPVAVQLSADGVYGVTLVASNGRGVGGTPPASGDSPDLLIEVDTTKPSAKITQSQAFLENGVPTVMIAWTVSDKNLGERPVELYCSANAQGPWMPIAKKLESSGQYRWTSASGVGPQAYLRLVTRDLAGNESISGLADPIHFSDQMKLRAVIRSIRTDEAAPTPVTVIGN